ncbi:MAG: phosphotransferase [Spirochaetales bacterium]|nr:phosphotransferase [Spirochaetales bacterium]
MKHLPDQVKAELSPRFDTAPDALTFLGGGQDWSDGTLFHYTQGGVEKVVKFIEFAETDDTALLRMEEKILYVKRLAESGTRLIEPGLSANGNCFETFSFDGKIWLAYCYSFVPGRPVRLNDPCVRNGQFHEQVGFILGKLHTTAAALPENMETENGIPVNNISHWPEEWEFFRSWCKDDEVGKAWEHLKSAVEGLPVDGSVYGFVHNDAHAANFIMSPDSIMYHGKNPPDLTLIDFDVAGFHFFACDAATTLYSFLSLETGGIENNKKVDKERKRFLYDAFLRGYQQNRSLPPDWMDHLRLFMQYRRCLLFMPFQEQTAKYPAWRDRWKARIREEDGKLFG